MGAEVRPLAPLPLAGWPLPPCVHAPMPLPLPRPPFPPPPLTGPEKLAGGTSLKRRPTGGQLRNHGVFPASFVGKMSSCLGRESQKLGVENSTVWVPILPLPPPFVLCVVGGAVCQPASPFPAQLFPFWPPWALDGGSVGCQCGHFQSFHQHRSPYQQALLPTGHSCPMLFCSLPRPPWPRGSTLCPPFLPLPFPSCGCWKGQFLRLQFSPYQQLSLCCPVVDWSQARALPGGDLAQ